MNLDTQAKQKIESIFETLQLENFNCSEVQKKEYNFEFDAIKNKSKVKIQVYFGQKGVKIILQGKKETDEFKEIDSLINGNYEFNFAKSPYSFDEYIGTDESGKGDYFGPLIVAGMYVDKEIQKYLHFLGTKDSKELNDTKIAHIAKSIKNKYPNNYQIIKITPEKYNQLFNKFLNLNKILDWAHSKVIENLLGNYKPGLVITDKFQIKNLSISEKFDNRIIEFLQIPQGEKFIGVAAASILARNELNYWFMTNKFLGYNLQKGASELVNVQAQQILSLKGEEELKKFAKIHFKTTKKLL